MAEALEAPEKIDLPVHALILIEKDFSGFFPLKVKIREENMAGDERVYEIKEIIRND